MNTQLAKELGLEFPIFAFTHWRDVVAAVSKAGGLGVTGLRRLSTGKQAIPLFYAGFETR